MWGLSGLGGYHQMPLWKPVSCSVFDVRPISRNYVVSPSLSTVIFFRSKKKIYSIFLESNVSMFLWLVDSDYEFRVFFKRATNDYRAIRIWHIWLEDDGTRFSDLLWPDFTATGGAHKLVSQSQGAQVTESAFEDDKITIEVDGIHMLRGRLAPIISESFISDSMFNVFACHGIGMSFNCNSRECLLC